MRRRVILLGVLALMLVGTPVVARARVGVDLGFEIGAPPALVPVPASPVLYAPAVPVSYFAYAGQYFVFANGAWYASAGYDGPWILLAPEYVPPAILAVPVRYYRARPPAWGTWRPEAAPRWGARFGTRWNEHRRAGWGRR